MYSKYKIVLSIPNRIIISRSTRREHSGSGLRAELGPLSSDSTPNMHNPLLSLLYVSVNS